MSFPQSETVAIAVDASGDATVYSSVIRGTLRHLRYLPGTLDTGADLTVTLETSGIEVLAKLNAGTSDITYSPQQKVQKNADGADALFSTGNEVRTPIFIANERVKIVVAQGGVSMAGSIIIVWD